MYIRLTNGTPEVYTIRQLRRANPDVSFPNAISDATLAKYDVYPYTRPEQPIYDNLTHIVVDDTLRQDVEGNWFMPWVVLQLPEDQAASNVRSQRDSLLADTDWIVIKASETGAPIPEEWVVYRQALRDITSQEGFPFAVTWPTKP